MLSASHRWLSGMLVAVSLTLGCTPANNAAAGAKSFLNEVGDAATDASINFAVNAALFDDDLVTSKELGVSTKSGTVTLRGTQPTQEAKVRAIQLASQVHGVRGVVDQIAVGPPGTPIPKAQPVVIKTAPTSSGKAPAPPPGPPPPPPPVAPPESVWQ